MNQPLSSSRHSLYDLTACDDGSCRRLDAFEIYVDDDRYAVPTLHLIMADDQEKARIIVERMLDDSPHHLGAEICLAGERLVGLGTFAVRRAVMDGPTPEPT